MSWYTGELAESTSAFLGGGMKGGYSCEDEPDTV